MNIRFGFPLAIILAWLAPAQTTVVHAGLLLDGKGGVPNDQLITVSGTHILSVAKDSGPADIELGKFTVMPGWIDTHVHLDWHFGKDGKLAKTGADKPEEVVLFDAEKCLAYFAGRLHDCVRCSPITRPGQI